MKRYFQTAACLAILLSLCLVHSSAQTKWSIGGRLGLSSLDGESGLQIGPTAELTIRRDISFGTELNINTQAGTPVEWADYVRYVFTIPGSQIKPYADGGFSLWFVTGGPDFALRFGGGAMIPVAPKLSVPVDLHVGPVFATGSTVFYLVIAGGIRYEI
jgi:hypothetical protein